MPRLLAIGDIHGCLDALLTLVQFVELRVSGKIMVCGHRIQSSGLPATNGNAICIDTGAYKNGWLTCLDVDTGDFWQAKQSGKTRRMKLKDQTNES